VRFYAFADFYAKSADARSPASMPEMPILLSRGPLSCAGYQSAIYVRLSTASTGKMANGRFYRRTIAVRILLADEFQAGTSDNP
jgi:hypothetical protein